MDFKTVLFQFYRTLKTVQMRIILTLAVLLSTTLSWAQYNANTRQFPMNPQPIQYTVEQYLLYHNVKTVVYKSGYNHFIFEFNPDRTIKHWDTGVGKTKYSYDKEGRLIGKNDGYVSSKIKTDEMGRVIEEKFKDGSGSIYMYDANGLFTELRDLRTSRIQQQYLYDSNGRLIKSTFFDASEIPEQISTYGYEDLITHHKVVVTTKLAGTALPTKETYYYTKRGELGSSDYKNDVYTKDRKSNVTSFYDSANKATTTFDITYY